MYSIYLKRDRAQSIYLAKFDLTLPFGRELGVVRLRAERSLAAGEKNPDNPVDPV